MSWSEHAETAALAVPPPVHGSLTGYILMAWAGFCVGFLFGAWWAGRHD